MDRGTVAKNLFLSGCNCAQSVVLAFADTINIPEEELRAIATGFGGGFARQRLICGAVSGMAMVIGLLEKGAEKGEVYADIQAACEEFKLHTGSIICGELLGGKIAKDTSPTPEKRTEEYYAKRPCPDMCALAAEIAEKLLVKKGVLPQ